MGNERMSDVVVAFDPSFVCWGWVVFEVGKKDKVLAAGAVQTKPNSKAKRQVRKADDDDRRAQELIDFLNVQVIGSHNPKAMYCEAITGGSRSSRAAFGLGIAKGIVNFLVNAQSEIPMEYYHPHEIREVVLGKVEGSKKAVQDIALQEFPDLEKHFTLTKFGKVDQKVREAICDAAAVFLTARANSPLYKLLKR